jgi:hypothetical protein
MLLGRVSMLPTDALSAAHDESRNVNAVVALANIAVVQRLIKSGHLFINRSCGRSVRRRRSFQRPQTEMAFWAAGPWAERFRPARRSIPLSTQVDARAEASIDLAVIGKG